MQGGPRNIQAALDDRENRGGVQHGITYVYIYIGMQGAGCRQAFEQQGPLLLLGAGSATASGF